MTRNYNETIDYFIEVVQREGWKPGYFRRHIICSNKPGSNGEPACLIGELLTTEEQATVDSAAQVTTLPDSVLTRLTKEFDLEALVDVQAAHDSFDADNIETFNKNDLLAKLRKHKED